MANLRIKGLGGMDEVGASSVQVEFPDIDRNLLLDSGIRMINEHGPHGELTRRTRGHIPPDVRIDAALITHGHSDHHGDLPRQWPRILDTSPNAKVFMTKPTFYIAGNLWLNTSYLMANKKIKVDLDYEANFAKGVRMIVEQAKNDLIEKPGWVEIFPGVEAYFGPNGHIRGSAFIVLRINGKTQIMFSGDMSVYDSPTVKGMKIPEEFIGRLDAIFVESTYGDRVLIPRAEEDERIAALAKDTINRGGICLAPAFGVGRSPDAVIAQEIRGVAPLYLDGMGKQFMEICASSNGHWCDLDHMSGVNLAESGIRYVESRDEREELIYESGGFSVVTTAGMLIEGSCAWQYLTKNSFLHNPSNRLLLTGYQAEDTEGREIEEGIEQSRPIRLAGRLINVEADVPTRLQLSSHADGTQIAEMVNVLQPKKVFINHGNNNGREGLKRNLENLGFGGEIHLPNNGETIEF